jgi:hypothetical protein
MRTIPHRFYYYILWQLKTVTVPLLVLLAALLYLQGCTTPPKIENESIPAKPEITIQIASINLALFNKRFEQKYIIELSKILKNEQIEVLAVQGISRYPGIAARVDFVNELSAKTEWHNVFGEMMNISGKQTGNAIFTLYPILSHENFSWEKVIKTSFDAALQATIDAGARSLTVVSTHMPVKSTADEQEQCSKLIASMNADTINQPTIVTGNLPAEESARAVSSFVEVPLPEFSKGSTSRIWYSANTTIQLLGARSVETELGTLLIAQFGLSRQQKH